MKLETVSNFTRSTHDNFTLSRVLLPSLRNSPPGIHLVTLPRQLRFFFAPEEIDEAALANRLAAGAESRPECAAGTRRAYRADWKDFQSFCRKTNRESLPALSRTVSLYLMWLEGSGKAVATLTRRLAAITSHHRSAGHPTPCNREVGDTLSQIRRRRGTGQKPKTPVTAAELTAMLAVLGGEVRGLRNQAILLMGFASGCRRSELAALTLADVTVNAEGMILHIAKSKTDQQGKGRDIGVHRGDKLCPVAMLQAWLCARGDWEGPLFCRIGPRGLAKLGLSPAAIGEVVKAAARRAGLDPARYAGHSLRSGCATAAAAAGADILAIARRLGHASTQTTERYVRHGSLFAVNPLKGVL